MAIDMDGSNSPDGRVRTFRLVGRDVEPVALAAHTLDQASLSLPQGAYTTLRTYDGDRFLRLESHLHRLDESVSLLGHPVELDHVAIRAGLRRMLQLAGLEESRLRISVAVSGDDPPVQVYLSVEPFVKVPDEIYARGVRAVTRLLARQQPRAKNTGFIAPSRQLKHALPPEIYEVLIANEQGQILEGTTSNFFAVLDGTLRTAGEGVLEGVTRSLVLQVAEQRLPVCLEPVTQGDFPILTEAFLTSASREVIPIIDIDGERIGTGVPGPVARELLVEYRARVLIEAQPA